MRTISPCLFLVAISAVALACLSAQAEDKKEKSSPAGVWQKKDGQLRLEFCDKNVIKIFPHGDKAEITILCKYTTGKDGLIKAKIAEFEGKPEVTEKLKGIVPIGLEFSFKYLAKDKTATLDDVKGDNVDALKSHLEGEYEQK